MSIVPFPTLEEMQSFGWEHRYIVAMAEASKEYESEVYQRNVRRLDMLRDQMAATTSPHDRTLLADEIDRLESAVEAEAKRLGLSE